MRKLVIASCISLLSIISVFTLHAPVQANSSSGFFDLLEQRLPHFSSWLTQSVATLNEHYDKTTSGVTTTQDGGTVQTENEFIGDSSHELQGTEKFIEPVPDSSVVNETVTNTVDSGSLSAAQNEELTEPSTVQIDSIHDSTVESSQSETAIRYDTTDTSVKDELTQNTTFSEVEPSYDSVQNTEIVNTQTTNGTESESETITTEARNSAEIVKDIEEAHILTEKFEEELKTITTSAYEEVDKVIQKAEQHISNANLSEGEKDEVTKSVRVSADQAKKIIQTNTRPTRIISDTETNATKSEDEIEAALRQVVKPVQEVVLNVENDIEENIWAVRNKVETVKQNLRTNQKTSLIVPIYADSDSDGVSDYDEVHIYQTNPRNPRTSGSDKTDGERILAGLNPLENTNEKVVYQLPTEVSMDDGVIEVDIFTLDSATVTTDIDSTTPSEAVVSFTGRAFPNSYVTVYIFSTPIIVTLKTDDEGVWQYSLDRELPDGQHTLYVATVNSSGKILAQSRPVPFVKEAQAVTVSNTISETAEASQKTGFFQSYLWLLTLGGLLFVAGVTLLIMGIIDARHENYIQE